MVGVPPVWLRLLRRVARAVFVYIDVVEAVEAEEAEEAKVQRDHGDPRWSCLDLGHFDGLRSTFL